MRKDTPDDLWRRIIRSLQIYKRNMGVNINTERLENINILLGVKVRKSQQPNLKMKYIPVKSTRPDIDELWVETLRNLRSLKLYSGIDNMVIDAFILKIDSMLSNKLIKPLRPYSE